MSSILGGRENGSGLGVVMWCKVTRYTLERFTLSPRGSRAVGGDVGRQSKVR